MGWAGRRRPHRVRRDRQTSQARVRAVGPPGLLGAEQLGGASGGGGLGGPALLLPEHRQGQAHPAQLVRGLQELAGVALPDELHAAQPTGRSAGPNTRAGRDGQPAALSAGRPVIGQGSPVDRSGPGPFGQAADRREDLACGDRSGFRHRAGSRLPAGSSP